MKQSWNQLVGAVFDIQLVAVVFGIMLISVAFDIQLVFRARSAAVFDTIPWAFVDLFHIPVFVLFQAFLIIATDVIPMLYVAVIQSISDAALVVAFFEVQLPLTIK